MMTLNPKEGKDASKKQPVVDHQDKLRRSDGNLVAGVPCLLCCLSITVARLVGNIHFAACEYEKKSG